MRMGGWGVGTDGSIRVRPPPLDPVRVVGVARCGMWLCGNFDVIFGPFVTPFPPFLPPPLTPHGIIYEEYIFDADLCPAIIIRRCDRFRSHSTARTARMIRRNVSSMPPRSPAFARSTVAPPATPSAGILISTRRQARTTAAGTVTSTSSQKKCPVFFPRCPILMCRVTYEHAALIDASRCFGRCCVQNGAKWGKMGQNGGLQAG